MTTVDFITELFIRVDDLQRDIPKHPQAHLYASELTTLGLLFAIKGVGNRAFYRWVDRDLRPLFPRLPERTRLFRLFAEHWPLICQFLEEPTILGVADTYGIELVHPIREHSHPPRQRIAKKGKSNYRWILGAKLCFVLNQFGLVVDFGLDTANVSDNTFAPIIAQYDEQMQVLADQGFHAEEGDPINLKICRKGTWNDRMVVETVLSMLTNVCHLKKVGHRVWAYLTARIAFTMAAFNILVQWYGFQPDQSQFIPLSIAGFSL